MATYVYENSFSDFIEHINYCRNNAGPFKLHLKQWEYDLFMKHHLLDSFPADRIVIVPDVVIGG